MHRRLRSLRILPRQVKEMKQIKNPVILVFAIIGAYAVLFGAWHSLPATSRYRAGEDFFLDATPSWPA